MDNLFVINAILCTVCQKQKFFGGLNTPTNWLLGKVTQFGANIFEYISLEISNSSDNTSVENTCWCVPAKPIGHKVVWLFEVVTVFSDNYAWPQTGLAEISDTVWNHWPNTCMCKSTICLLYGVNKLGFTCYETTIYMYKIHDDVIKWKVFRVTGPLCGEFTGPRWIPRTKASDAELWCFLWSASE